MSRGLISIDAGRCALATRGAPGEWRYPHGIWAGTWKLTWRRQVVRNRSAAAMKLMPRVEVPLGCNVKPQRD